ncbi:hypothetical protein MNBD_GAMMA15-2314 [hydrothermal vent metagenome]|uniref:Type II secretion system protein J n=1 Tax=hydrothermal vent metagenome TaxID=652676 RepID=A0A3B0YH23_9ZZZZ
MKPVRGFTLLELLVALSIFAAIGVMAWGGLSSVMRQQAQTEKYSDRMHDLQLAYRIFQRDLEQFVDRDIRNEFGDVVPALVAGGNYRGVEFSRIGHPNPANFLRSNVQRVAYLMDDTRLLRRSWRVLDRSQDTLPDEQMLVEGVQNFVMRYLDQNKNWQDRWPPAAALGVSPTGSGPQWPLAVEVQLSLEDLGVLRWIFRLPDTYRPPSSPGGSGSGVQGGGNT